MVINAGLSLSAASETSSTTFLSFPMMASISVSPVIYMRLSLSYQRVSS